MLTPDRVLRTAAIIEGLYELPAISVKEMLTAPDTRQDNLKAYKALRKQVELLLEIIDEKKNETKPAIQTIVE